ncbi:hypothetical protein YC2023_122618 [Brassica napus]
MEKQSKFLLEKNCTIPTKPTETRKGEISTGDLDMKLRSPTLVRLLTNFRRKRPVTWLYGCYIRSLLDLRVSRQS